MSNERTREPATLPRKGVAFHAGNEGSNPSGDTRSTVGYEGDGALKDHQEVPSSSPRAHHRKGTEDQRLPPSAIAPAGLREFSLREYGAVVYFLVNAGTLVYVGQSVALPSRLAQHIEAKKFDQVFYVPVERKDLDLLEYALIRALRPPLNRTSGALRDVSDEAAAMLDRYGFSHLKGSFHAGESEERWTELRSVRATGLGIAKLRRLVKKGELRWLEGGGRPPGFHADDVRRISAEQAVERQRLADEELAILRAQIDRVNFGPVVDLITKGAP